MKNWKWWDKRRRGRFVMSTSSQWLAFSRGCRVAYVHTHVCLLLSQVHYSLSYLVKSLGWVCHGVVSWFWQNENNHFRFSNLSLIAEYWVLSIYGTIYTQSVLGRVRCFCLLFAEITLSMGGWSSLCTYLSCKLGYIQVHKYDSWLYSGVNY